MSNLHNLTYCCFKQIATVGRTYTVSFHVVQHPQLKDKTGTNVIEYKATSRTAPGRQHPQFLNVVGD